MASVQCYGMDYLGMGLYRRVAPEFARHMIGCTAAASRRGARRRCIAMVRIAAT